MLKQITEETSGVHMLCSHFLPFIQPLACRRDSIIQHLEHWRWYFPGPSFTPDYHPPFGIASPIDYCSLSPSLTPFLGEIAFIPIAYRHVVCHVSFVDPSHLSHPGVKLTPFYLNLFMNLVSLLL